MQALLEYQYRGLVSGRAARHSAAGPRGGRGGGPWYRQLVFVVVAVFAFALVLWLQLAPDSAGHAGSPPWLAPHVKHGTGGHLHGNGPANSRATHGTTSPPAAPAGIAAGHVRPLAAWGYNRDRNVPRWEAIGRELAADAPHHGGRFTLVDYGSDQGFFSISTASAWPQALVMGLEMGGVGGEIWKKSGDVLLVQEGKLEEHHVRNMAICQTKVIPSMFDALAAGSVAHDYQFVLSVFHWFELPTQDEFHRVAARLFSNARTTFIELPTIGDDGPMIRKQVGYRNWRQWYAGRTDVAEVLRGVGAAAGMDLSVAEVAAVQWLQWRRVVYRVDNRRHLWPGHARALAGAGAASAEEFSTEMNCATRRAIYTCRHRERFTCPAN